MESFHQNYVVIFQTTILRIVGFYVRRSADLSDLSLKKMQKVLMKIEEMVGVFLNSDNLRHMHF